MPVKRDSPKTPVRGFNRWLQERFGRRRSIVVGLGCGAIAVTSLVVANLWTAPQTTLTYDEYLKAIREQTIERILVRPDGALVTIRGESEPQWVDLPLIQHPVRELLAGSGATVTFQPSNSTANGVAAIGSLVLQLLLIGGIVAYLGRTARKTTTIVDVFRPATGSDRTTFASVAGNAAAKRDLQDVVDYLRDPSRYEALGARAPRGVLMTGPTGTGKTLLARALAGEAGVPCLYTSGSRFVEMFVGLGPRKIRSMIERARAEAPCILFIDEIDSLGRRRENGGDSASQEFTNTLNELLVALDGLNGAPGVVLIGATNRPEVLDAALLRPGRLDRKVEVPLPDLNERTEILALHARSKPLAPDIDLQTIARRTPGMSGADLEAIINDAALLAARRGAPLIGPAEIEDSLDRTLLGAERRGLVMNPLQQRIVDVHEAGHALVAIRMPGAAPLAKVTRIPRGRGLGLAATLPEDGLYTLPRSALIARLAFAYGGRAAEAVVFGEDEVSSGAEADLAEAGNLIGAMVYRLGMGRDLDGHALPLMGWPSEAHPFRPGMLPVERDFREAASRLARETYRTTVDLVRRDKAALLALAAALRDRETISGDEARSIVEKHPTPETDS